MKHSRGAYSDKVVERAGKIVGPLAKSMDAVFLEKVAEVDQTFSSKNKLKLGESVRTMVHEYREDNLFGNIPGRSHPSFPNATQHLNKHIKHPRLLKARLIKYSRKLDTSKNVLPM